MNAFSDFNGLINYIESNLFSEINVNVLAKMAKLSVYEFRRIFSFVVGTPVYEYIRKRRLSSCVKLLLSGEDLSCVASKCGYDNISSFSRAFKEFYGFSPSDLSKNCDKLKSFTKAGLDVIVKGGESIDYKILDLDEFYVCGLSGESCLTDTECCEDVWGKFDPTEFIKQHPNEENIYAVYLNGENVVKCYIGAKSVKPEQDSVLIPKSKWVCFSLRGSDDLVVNQFYKNVLYSWFDSNGFARNDKMPNIEVFPIDMEGDFVWNIYIPIL